MLYKYLNFCTWVGWDTVRMKSQFVLACYIQCILYYTPISLKQLHKYWPKGKDKTATKHCKNYFEHLAMWNLQGLPFCMGRDPTMSVFRCECRQYYYATWFQRKSQKWSEKSPPYQLPADSDDWVLEQMATQIPEFDRKPTGGPWKCDSHWWTFGQTYSRIRFRFDLWVKAN